MAEKHRTVKLVCNIAYFTKYILQVQLFSLLGTLNIFSTLRAKDVIPFCEEATAH